MFNNSKIVQAFGRKKNGPPANVFVSHTKMYNVHSLSSIPARVE